MANIVVEVFEGRVVSIYADMDVITTVFEREDYPDAETCCDEIDQYSAGMYMMWPKHEKQAPVKKIRKPNNGNSRWRSSEL